MGYGFPKRFTRDQLGPQLRNTYPVENPETDIGAETWNPLMHQVSGMNLVVPRVALVAAWGGAAFDLATQAEAWNPKGDQAHPVLGRTSTGDYTYTFAATYKDEDGVAQPLALGAPRVTPFGAPIGVLDYLPHAFTWIDTVNPLIVQLRIFDVANAYAPLDWPFWLEVM
jgi:hypothetical protein